MSWFGLATLRETQEILRQVLIVGGKIDALALQLKTFSQQEAKTMADATAALQQLTTEVATVTTVEASAVAALSGLSQQVKDLAAQLAAAGTPQAVVDQITAFSTALDTATAPLAAAIATPPTP